MNKGKPSHRMVAKENPSGAGRYPFPAGSRRINPPSTSLRHKKVPDAVETQSQKEKPPPAEVEHPGGARRRNHDPARARFHHRDCTTDLRGQGGAAPAMGCPDSAGGAGTLWRRH